MSDRSTELHLELRDLVDRLGSYVMTDPGEFRAAFEDVLGDGRELPPGTVNLLVDAVRHQVAAHVIHLVDNGADPIDAIRTAGARFADVRGGGDPAQCSWAAAVLGFAAGRVPETACQAYSTTQGTESTGSAPVPAPPVPAPPAPAPQTAVPPSPDLTRPIPFPPPSRPDQSGAPRRRRTLPVTLAVVGALLLLVAGAGVVWWALAGDPSEPSGSGRDAEDQRDVGQGILIADPGAIRPFADPVTEITSDRDLVDYLLPGLTGSGADCLVDEIDTDAVLGADLDEGAATVAGLVLGCVAPDEVGKIFGVYAVGFEEDGRSRYADLAVCVADGFGDLDRAEVEDALVTVYVERLDLAGPPTSRQAAADEIADLTTCSTDASPPPEESSETPEDPSPSAQNQRVVPWNLLQPGDCLVDLPAGRITQVTVVDCRTPHRIEVVGATFSGGSGDADAQCANLYVNYTGQSLEGSDQRLEYLEGEPGSLSARLICMATAADGSRTTGSIR